MEITSSELAIRRALEDARRDRLHFAQVREDPRLELETLEPASGATIVVVSSGGCTALSLLAAGAARVIAVDVNRTQNDLLELKHRAVVDLGVEGAVGFLGGAPSRGDRWIAYQRIRNGLTPGARAWWDGHRPAIRRGVLGAGVTERLVRTFVCLLRLAVHSRGTLEGLLALEDIAQQDAFFRERWDNRRWRLLVRLLLSRGSLGRTYDPAFFRGVEERDFATHFRARIEHTLRRIPVRENYFLHYMLTGRYPAGDTDALPPYLQPSAAEALREGGGSLEIVDGGYTTFLEGRAPASVDGFALSNICEWLDRKEQDRLFEQVSRTAAPGARVCFRNFVGWTEVPPRWRERIVEDRERGEAMMQVDRSLVQRRFAPCRIVPAPGGCGRVRVRDARRDDDAALRRLAAACPMRGDVSICAEREPEFLALTRLEGEAWWCAVVPDPLSGVGGCVTVALRTCYLNGRRVRVAHVGDLKVAPELRGGGVADALSRWARDLVARELGDDAPIIVTVLAGNRAMERRLPGGEGLPRFHRVGTIRTRSIPVFGRWRGRGIKGVDVRPAAASDLSAMAALWRAVAPLRQFTPGLDAAALADWIAAAPGLTPASYLLAHGPDGALQGFLGLWDQRSFKQLRVVRYAPRMKLFRGAFNRAALLCGATTLPPEGALMPCMTAVHLCVPPGRPHVLRSLLLEAYREARSRDHAFFNVGLDRRDPLCAAFRGFMAQSTDVHVYLTSPRGAFAGAPLDGRPLHYEVALV